jgi:hypothetical protein
MVAVITCNPPNPFPVHIALRTRVGQNVEPFLFRIFLDNRRGVFTVIHQLCVTVTVTVTAFSFQGDVVTPPPRHHLGIVQPGVAHFLVIVEVTAGDLR